ncbi:ndufa6 NADH-ubiquinone oxidoreductase subunit [Coemansia sp. BCRC 34490]|nr:ndufa6 NADH-ubiquinone oxidoreductase subunit [Coemansia sp. Benny D160-2]KAJ2515171.1 ndufa6 NADH-ubiquinone oxidoreductase subunit [Coemansia sp. RSA 1939]KAJ2741154.1 ndufa6 NADH-ubiquinone oxidoreductase subunit [Coemansia sp. BCRC 34490]
MPHVQPVITRASTSLADARTRALQLYRTWQKGVPKYMIDYHLCMPQSVVRAKIREEFEKNRFVSDPRAIDVLLLKGRMEYEETYNVWKQYSHVLRYFDSNEGAAEPTGFVDRFIEGRA